MILAVGSRHPEMDEFGTVFVCFFDQFGRGRVPRDPVQGSIPRRGEPARFNYHSRLEEPGSMTG